MSLALASPSLSLPAETEIGGGRYQLEGEIGRGGYGIIYRAKRIEDDGIVAIKEYVLPGCLREGLEVVAPDMAAQGALESWSQRVVEQAHGLKGVAHPHLARLYEAWRENNTVYLAMEMLDGPTLSQHIEAQGPMPPEEAVARAEEIGEALAELHKRGLLHLDVKPENAVLTLRGAVLLDFDLVQPLGNADLQTRPLSLGSRIGTPGYAPPEAYGERAPQTVQSDIYSLGATLYFLLCGQTPPSAVDRAAGIELEPLAIPEYLQRSLESALRLPINERPESLAALRESWKAPPPPPLPEEDYSFSAHHANLAQSQMKSGVYRVVLTLPDPEFPPRCACCFEKADKDTHLPVNSPSGKRFVPGCHACLRHQIVARASANGTGWGAAMSLPIVVAGVAFCVTSDSFLQLVFGLSLCVLALFVYFSSISYGALKSSRAEEMLKSSCCTLIEPVTYTYNGKVYIWRFKNVMYAKEFQKINKQFVV